MALAGRSGAVIEDMAQMAIAAAQRISTRMPSRSTCVATFSSLTGWKKLGQPVPELNLASEEKSGSLQQTQA